MKEWKHLQEQLKLVGFQAIIACIAYIIFGGCKSRYFFRYPLIHKI